MIVFTIPSIETMTCNKNYQCSTKHNFHGIFSYETKLSIKPSSNLRFKPKHKILRSDIVEVTACFDNQCPFINPVDRLLPVKYFISLPKYKDSLLKNRKNLETLTNKEHLNFREYLSDTNLQYSMTVKTNWFFNISALIFIVILNIILLLISGYFYKNKTEDNSLLYKLLLIETLISILIYLFIFH